MRPVLYDKSEVAAHFGRAAQRYTQLADVQRYAGQVLLNMLHSHSTSNAQETVMDLGCGPGIFTAELSKLAPIYTGVDISAAMLAQAQKMNPKQRFVLGDMEDLPFPQDTMSLIYSNLAVQWANSLSRLCAETWRTLRPGGCFAFSTVLPNSLMPLAQLRGAYALSGAHGNNESVESLGSAAHVGINEHRSFQEWCTALKEVGFTLGYAEQRKVTGYFPNVSALIRSISGIGADYQALPQRELSRSELIYLQKAYAPYRTHAGLPLDYSVGFFIAHKSMQ
ncbi:methyltransferase domain-containing protein [Aliidiomarina halalkaliphila]|uniref:Malonyl-[acyl-carrier protein] O-methyltransferase n=1 Tax=Aliidiomarina halalkaliphila TaxID=2593535 RepID=A0A552X419_9GAMM|nr:methyltransferase domain-containing protein [Aliidiomarina halalkaliphila]TRW49780.1 methyltransferase domain-containing protein [Aliidiomarina halalkaliphila]